MSAPARFLSCGVPSVRISLYWSLITTIFVTVAVCALTLCCALLLVPLHDASFSFVIYLAQCYFLFCIDLNETWFVFRFRDEPTNCCLISTVSGRNIISMTTGWLRCVCRGTAIKVSSSGSRAAQENIVMISSLKLIRLYKFTSWEVLTRFVRFPHFKPRWTKHKKHKCFLREEKEALTSVCPSQPQSVTMWEVTCVKQQENNELDYIIHLIIHHWTFDSSVDVSVNCFSTVLRGSQAVYLNIFLKHVSAADGVKIGWGSETHQSWKQQQSECNCTRISLFTQVMF